MGNIDQYDFPGCWGAVVDEWETLFKGHEAQVEKNSDIIDYALKHDFVWVAFDVEAKG